VRLLPGMTVEDNVAAGCYAMARRSGLRHVMSSMMSPRRFTGEIRDAAFARLFFAVWLSPRTSEPALRSALLGKRP
jgi:hypothetical protein